MAKARKFTHSRITQALDAAGITGEQRQKFLDSLENKPAPMGRPSRARLAKAAFDEQRELEQRLAEWQANRYKNKKGPTFSADPEDT